MKKISLIIPVYNSERYLNTLLDSIVTQTHSNYEVIFVNDGSTDNSQDIIKEYQKSYKNIKLISIENSGPGVARKIGFENSSGELLFFIDSDDYLPRENVLEIISNLYDNHKFDLLVFNFERNYNEKTTIVNAFYRNNIKVGMNDTTYLKTHDLIGALWSKIFVRKKMKTEFFFNSNNYEDFYTSYKYLDECRNFYYTDEVLYATNRDNENSISKKQNYKKIQKAVEVLKIIYNDSNYKKAVMLVILKYYFSVTKMLKQKSFSNNERTKIYQSLDELLKIMDFKQLIKLPLSLKDYIKLFLCLLDKERRR